MTVVYASMRRGLSTNLPIHVLTYMDMWRTSDPWHAGRDARIGGRILKSLVRARVFFVVGGVGRI